jgi:hypothetical protein
LRSGTFRRRRGATSISTSSIFSAGGDGRTLAEKIPGAKLRIIEGVGHLFWISHPEETVAEVVMFFGERCVSEQVDAVFFNNIYIYIF